MKDSHKILMTALIAGAGVWLLDGLVDWLVFYRDNTLLELLFLDVPEHEIYIRCLILLILLIFGWIVGRIMEHRREAEAELEKSEALLSSVIDQSPFPTWIADANGINIRQNKAFHNLLALDDDQRTVGRYNLFEDNVLEEQGHIEKLERVFLRGEPVTFVTHYDISRVEQLCLPDGPKLLLEVTVFPISDRSGRVVNAVVQCEDITEKRKVDEAIRESEERFRAMFDTTRDVMAIIDDSDRLRWTNLAWCDVFGFRPGAPVDWFDKLHPDDLVRFTTLWHNVQNGIGEVTNLELRFKSINGRYIYLETTIRPIEVDRREMMFFDGYDVTLRKRAEQKLAEEKELLGVTLRSIAEGVIATDAQGNVVLINAVAEELTGSSQIDSAGKPLAEVLRIFPEGAEDPTENPMNFIPDEKSDSAHNGTIELLPIGGTMRLVSIGRSSLTTESGEILGSVIVFRDITQSRKIDEELQRADKLESLGTLAGGIAHDFNNILTSILGNIELAKIYSAGSGKAEETLDRAKESALSARELTGRLLTFSKGGAPLKRKHSAGPIIGESVKLALSGSKVSCQFDLTDDLWEIEVDIEQFEQVMRNLTVNAVQSMPDGGNLLVEAINCPAGTPNMARLAGPFVTISVTDNGVGIDKELLPRIFDPFFSTSDRASGLGLSVSYSIIQRHGGLIDVRSEPGQGSTFSILLPAFPSTADVAKSETGITDTIDSNSSATARVLVLDDEQTVRDVICSMLRHLGHSCDAVEKGEQAIELYNQAISEGNPHDLVILDLTIPGGLGGMETLEELKKLDPDVRAVVSSGYSDDPVISNHSAHGFAGSLVKPYELAQVVKLMSHIFG